MTLVYAFQIKIGLSHNLKIWIILNCIQPALSKYDYTVQKSIIQTTLRAYKMISLKLDFKNALRFIHLILFNFTMIHFQGTLAMNSEKVR